MRASQTVIRGWPAVSGLTFGGSGGQWNLAGDSTLTGAINFATGSSQTFNTGAFTLNLDTATLTRTTTGVAAFNVGSGGALNNKSNASSITTAGNVTLSNGSITNTSSGATAGLFTIANPITGFGTISGNDALTGTSLTASGGTLTVNAGSGAAGTGIVLGTGLAAVATGNTLDLQGTIGVHGSMTMNPGVGGLIKLDGASFSPTGGTGAINTNATTTAGTFDVVAATSFTSVAFSAGSAASFLIDAPLNLVDAASSASAKNVSLNGQTVSGLGTLTGTTAITSTGASTLAAPFAGAALNVNSGTLDIKSAGT
jgi:hypothetical protein